VSEDVVSASAAAAAVGDANILVRICPALRSSTPCSHSRAATKEDMRGEVA